MVFIMNRQTEALREISGYRLRSNNRFRALNGRCVKKKTLNYGIYKVIDTWSQFFMFAPLIVHSKMEEQSELEEMQCIGPCPK